MSLLSNPDVLTVLAEGQNEGVNPYFVGGLTLAGLLLLLWITTRLNRDR
ncbi:hypothetical protein GCM10009716_37220 [Streptomyces sodiiphilus]|uniref:LPXTG cell wall anchor domain-containing protein n=1 Tax=Streptomyces sodiiphilus TaxID=226217 RepID=A0ABN2PM75_9ACTN